MRKKFSVRTGLVVGLLCAAALGIWVTTRLMLDLTVVPGWHDAASPPEPVVIDANDVALVDEGRAVYDENCASCHGLQLEGQPNWRRRLPDGRLPAPPHDESGHTWHHHDALLFDMVSRGGQPFMPEGMESGMPGFGEALTRREMIAALAYIKSRWPTRLRQMQQARPAPPG